MENLKRNKFKDIFLNYLDVILFVVIIEAKILYAMHEILKKDFSITVLLLPTFSLLLMVTAFTLLVKNKTRTRTLLILDFVISGCLMADTIYYGYFRDILSVAAVNSGIKLTGDSASTYSVLKSVIKPSDFLFLVDLIVFVALFRKYTKRERKQSTIKLRLSFFAVLLLIGGVVDAGCIYELNSDKPRLMETMSNKTFIVENLGTANFHFLDAYHSAKTLITANDPIGDKRDQEIKVFLQSNEVESTNTFSKIGTGKNLIVIQVEALQQFAIDAKVNGKEVTPNLNKWLGKSLYFDNFFYQTAEGNTSDAEFMVNNSLYPAASGVAYFRYTNKELTSLPGALKENGYYTSAFHGNYSNFYDRDKMYVNMGFDDFFSEERLKVDEKIGMGMSDKSFLRQSLDKINSFKQPYFSFLITLSSHYPFNRDTNKYGTFDEGKYKNTLMGDYLKGIHYADTQLGWFLDSLEKEGMLDNSIVVLYGDHNALPKNYSDKLYDLLDIHDSNDLIWYELQKVPMFIHFPKDANAGVNHTYSGQMDLYPTIANMFDLKKQNMFGKDILNPPNQNVIFRNGSFTNGNIFYISWNDKFYDIASGKELSSTPALRKLETEANDQLSYSDDILNHNLIKEFKAEK